MTIRIDVRSAWDGLNHDKVTLYRVLRFRCLVLGTLIKAKNNCIELVIT